MRSNMQSPGEKSVWETKKAQYLTLDAFIGVMIVVVAIVIILAARSAAPYTAESEAISKGFAESLSSVKLSEINNPLVINLTKNKTITNTDNTLLQQATEFYWVKEKYFANELIKNVQIYARYAGGPAQGNNENTSGVLVSSKKLIFGVINRTAQVYGPTIA